MFVLLISVLGFLLCERLFGGQHIHDYFTIRSKTVPRPLFPRSRSELNIYLKIMHDILVVYPVELVYKYVTVRVETRERRRKKTDLINSVQDSEFSLRLATTQFLPSTAAAASTSFC